MLLCAGNADPAVLCLNTQLMQNYWSTATTVSVLDIDSAVASGDPYEAQRTKVAVAKAIVLRRVVEHDRQLSLATLQAA